MEVRAGGRQIIISRVHISMLIFILIACGKLHKNGLTRVIITNYCSLFERSTCSKLLGRMKKRPSDDLYVTHIAPPEERWKHIVNVHKSVAYRESNSASVEIWYNRLDDV